MATVAELDALFASPESAPPSAATTGTTVEELDALFAVSQPAAPPVAPRATPPPTVLRPERSGFVPPAVSAAIPAAVGQRFEQAGFVPPSAVGEAIQPRTAGEAVESVLGGAPRPLSPELAATPRPVSPAAEKTSVISAPEAMARSREIAEAGPVMGTLKVIGDELRGSDPVTAAKIGMKYSLSGLLGQIAAGGEAFKREEQQYNPTLIDKGIEVAFNLAADPLTAAAFLVGSVPGAAGGRAIALGLARRLGASRALALTERMGTAMGGSATSFAGFDAARTTLQQTASTVRGEPSGYDAKTGEPYWGIRLGEVGRAAGKGAVLGGAMGLGAIFTAPALRIASEIGILASVPPIQEGRPPTVVDLLDAGVLVGTLKIAGKIKEQGKRALAKPLAERTPEDRRIVEVLPEEIKAAVAKEASEAILKGAAEAGLARRAAAPAVEAEPPAEAPLRTTAEAGLERRGVEIPAPTERTVEQAAERGRQATFGRPAGIVTPTGAPAEAEPTEPGGPLRSRAEVVRERAGLPTTEEHTSPGGVRFRLNLPPRATTPVQETRTAAEPEQAPPERRPAPATFIGWQERPNREPLALYNLTEDVPGHKQGSTVSTGTLRDLGFEPPAPMEPPPTSTPKTPLPSREAIFTPEQLRNLTFPVPEGGRSKTPKTVFDWRERGEQFETLADLATYDDPWRFREALGEGWPDLGPTSLHLADRITRNEPITVYRAIPREEGGLIPGILPGAYVSESRRYAQTHGEANIPGKFKIESLDVYPDELMTYGDAHEFIYVPRSLDIAHERLYGRAEAGQQAPRFERTAEGEQALVPGTEARQIPTTPLRAEEPQRPIGETPLFRTAPEAEQPRLPQGAQPTEAAPIRPSAERPTPSPAEAFDPTDIDQLSRFVVANGSIAPSPTGDLVGEYRAIPLRFKNRRGLTPDRMAQAVSEAAGLDVSDAELLDALAHRTRLGQKKLKREQVEATAESRADEDAQRLRDLADLPEEEKVKRVAAMLGTGEDAARRVIDTQRRAGEQEEAKTPLSEQEQDREAFARAARDYFSAVPDAPAEPSVVDRGPLADQFGSARAVADRLGGEDVVRRELAAAKADVEAGVVLPERDFGATNTIFTRATHDAALNALKEKFGGETLRTGVDPTILTDLVKVGGFYFEGGVREFAAWSGKMVEALGERIRPYLERTWARILAEPEVYRAPTFVPTLRGVLERKMPETAFTQQVAAIAKNPMIPAEEVKWSGLDDWLVARGGKRVTKREVMELLDQNEVRVDETVLGTTGMLTPEERQELDQLESRISRSEVSAEAPRISAEERQRYEALYDRLNASPAAKPKFEKFSLPGARPGTYRELLLTLPGQRTKLTEAQQRLEASSDRLEALGAGLRTALREALLTKPLYKALGERGPESARARAQTMVARLHDVRGNYPDVLENARDLLGMNHPQLKAFRDEVQRNYDLIGETSDVERHEVAFRSPHWDEPNVLAHVRFNERRDADGKRVLFLEEIQSDWAQTGRRAGYQLEKLPDGWTVARDTQGERRRWLVRDETGHPIDEGRTAAEATQRGIEWANRQQGGIGTPVPRTPFAKTWHELVLKRTLRWAAENGFDRLAWTPGSVQADRYDLSKHIKNVRLSDNQSGGVAEADIEGPFASGLLTARDYSNREVIRQFVRGQDELVKYIGKEAAERLLAQAPTLAREAGLGIRLRELSGFDLKIGGEGMKGFYDQMIPAFLNKYGKKWGARVGETHVGRKGYSVVSLEQWQQEHGEFKPAIPSNKWLAIMPDRLDVAKSFPSESLARAYIQDLEAGNALRVPFVDITPEMRRSVLVEGQPLFGGQPPSPVEQAKERVTRAEMPTSGEPTPETTGLVQRVMNALTDEAGAINPRRPDPALLQDLAEYGREVIRARPDYEGWADAMQGEFGDRVGPYLRRTWQDIRRVAPEPEPAEPDPKPVRSPAVAQPVQRVKVKLDDAIPPAVERIRKRALKASSDLKQIRGRLIPEAEVVEREAETIAETGTLAPETRRPFRETVATKPETFTKRVSEQDIADTQAALVAMAREYRQLRTDVEQAADPFSHHTVRTVQDLMGQAQAGLNALAKEFRAQRFAAGRQVKRFDRPVPADVLAALEEAGVMSEWLARAKPRVPIYTNIVRSLRQFPMLTQPERRQLVRDLVDAWRLNLFSVSSWTLDFIGNATEVSMQAAGGVGRDLAQVGRGHANLPSLQGLFRALKDRALHVGVPLSESLETGLGTSIGGERVGGGFTGALSGSRPGTFTTREGVASRSLDLLVGSPLYAKGVFDTGAKRLMATATVWRDAIEAANRQGLRGQDRRAFYRDFMTNLPEATIERATEAGNKAGFNRPLSELEERIAGSVVVRLIGDVFARWPFQFTRTMGEWLGANPKLFRDVKAGTASAEDIASWLVVSATGWGALYLLNETLYNRVDFNSMEYVHEDGNRTRLSNRDPLPTALWLLATIKGDMARSTGALRYASLPGARLLSGEGGLFGGLVASFTKAVERADVDAGSVGRELTNTVNRLIPGQAVLSAIESIFDPVIREGIGANVPGVSSFLEPAITRTTGEPLQPRQTIAGVEMPTVGGTPIPGAQRIMDPIERMLSRYGLLIYRGPQTSIAGLYPADVPKDMLREWVIAFGQNRQRLLGPLAERMERGEFDQWNPDVVRQMISKKDALAADQARDVINAKYGTTAKLPRKPTIRERRGPAVFQQERQERTEALR